MNLGVNLDTWRTVFSIFSFVLPFLLGGFLWWAAKYFVSIKMYRADRKAATDNLILQLNGMGGRIQSIHDSCVGAAAQHDGLEGRVGTLEGDVKNFSKDLGRVEKSLEKIEDTVLLMKAEIIQAFQERAREMTDAANRLAVEVARLDERSKKESK